MMRLKMAWAPGAVLPNCSSTTGVMPRSNACRLYPFLCPYALHLFISSRRSSLFTASSGLTVWILTSNQSSEPCGSMMWMSALWTGLTLPGAGWPSAWIWSGMSIACSVVAVSPACRASFVMRSLTLSCRRVWSPLVQHAACLPYGSRMCWQRFPPGGVRPHCCPVPGAGNPSRWFMPNRNTGSRRVVSNLPGKQCSHSPCP